MRDLFAQDPDRFKKFSLEFDGLFFDFSKNRITDETMTLLRALAAERDVAGWAKKMFSGEKINITENRAVLHIALRNRSNTPILVDGKDVMPEVNAVLAHMKDFSDTVRSGEWKGYTGKPITDFVNIGIGGSDLGPVMVTEALKPYAQKGLTRPLRLQRRRHAHRRDAEEAQSRDHALHRRLEDLHHAGNPDQRPLRAQAGSSRQRRTSRHVAKHFVALSTNEKEVTKFGIDPDNMFGFWDWVGGRYSLWSAIGLPIALSIGYDNFVQLLEGGARHGRAFPQHAAGEESAHDARAARRLVQQFLRRAHRSPSCPTTSTCTASPPTSSRATWRATARASRARASPVDTVTGPVIWGEPGTNGQHAFYQLIHQGTQWIPADFIAPIETQNPLGEHHLILLSNFFAQTEALMKGKTPDEVRAELDEGRHDAARRWKS